jgi:hypothetical protein
VLGGPAEFRRHFEGPILAGREPGASPEVCVLFSIKMMGHEQALSWCFLSVALPAWENCSFCKEHGSMVGQIIESVLYML